MKDNKKKIYYKPILKIHGDLTKDTKNTESEGEADGAFYHT